MGIDPPPSSNLNNKNLKRDSTQIPKDNEGTSKRKTDIQNNFKKIKVTENKKPCINLVEKQNDNKDLSSIKNNVLENEITQNLHGKLVSDEIKVDPYGVD